MCCGIVYKGRYGEIIIDPHLFKPCCQRKPDLHQEKEEEGGEMEQEEEEEEDDEEGAQENGQNAVSLSPPSLPSEVKEELSGGAR